MKKYIISIEEKKYIKSFLNYDVRFNLNFLLSSIEDNLIIGSKDKTYSDIYRDANMYSKTALMLYSSIYKQSLNERINVDKIYIPLSLTEYNILKSNEKNNGYLLGTIQRFVAEAKPFPEIKDLVIVEAELKNLSIFKLDQSFDDSSLVIIGPSFKVIEKDEKYEIDEEFYKKNEIQERIFKKAVIEFAPNKNEEVQEEDLEALGEEAGNRAEDLQNYWEILSWTNNLEKALEEKDVKMLKKLGISPKRKEESLGKEEDLKDNKKELEDSEELIKSEDKEVENEVADINEKSEGKLQEERMDNISKQVNLETENIKKEIEAKAENIKKRLKILIDKTNYTSDGKPGKEILDLKEKIIKESEFEREYLFEDYEENAKEQIDLNYLEIHDIVKDIKDWKEAIVKGLNFEYLKTISKIESEKNEYMKNANFTKEEKQLYTDIFDSMKYNLEMTENLLNETEDLIKSQQKFAKIAAETNAKYSAVVDGFGIRNEAFKLKEILKKFNNDFEEKYYARVSEFKTKNKSKTRGKNKKGSTKKDKETKDNANNDAENIEDEKAEDLAKRISTTELKNILETSKQITVFLNMLFNPKMARPNTKINRFEELILIEENELKRKIFTYAKYLISEGNLDILEDEIEIIESKSALKKLLDIIAGKHKIENYYLERLEDTIDKIIEMSEKDLKIDRNYRIHDIIAEIMMFKSENSTDEVVEEILKKLSKLEIAIAKNFEVNPDKVIDVIEQKKSIAFPVSGNISKKEEIDIEIESLIRKYEYSEDIFVDKAEYEDTTKNEIRKIVDYAKISGN